VKYSQPADLQLSPSPWSTFPLLFYPLTAVSLMISELSPSAITDTQGRHAGTGRLGGETSSKSPARGRQQQRGERLFDLDTYLKRTQEGTENSCRTRERLEAGNLLQFHLNELAQGKHEKHCFPHSMASLVSMQCVHSCGPIVSNVTVSPRHAGPQPHGTRGAGIHTGRSARLLCSPYLMHSKSRDLHAGTHMGNTEKEVFILLC